uniref:Uncharacterized protein n=1 Tax=Romanomermis culicivorax TaxID=13658 RepID=A0A915JX09_ROMCU
MGGQLNRNGQIGRSGIVSAHKLWGASGGPGGVLTTETLLNLETPAILTALKTLLPPPPVSCRPNDDVVVDESAGVVDESAGVVGGDVDDDDWLDDEAEPARPCLI